MRYAASATWARIGSLLPTIVIAALVATLAMLLVGCSLLLDPGPTQVNNVFSNISDGLSQ